MLHEMKSFIALIIIFFSVSLNAQFSNSVNGELLVRIRPGFAPIDVERTFADAEGILPNLRLKEEVSEYLRIWLFTFDENVLTKADAIRRLNALSCVDVAQVNHILEERVVPDDPFFEQQWHHIQIEDHDIDTDLAWDITTGGLTANADEIVVCVVELGGAKWTATDIVENHWVNENETPGNGIDDDGNGYIDDYDGWNATSQSDNLSEGDHGTRVCSMIGAKGNNTTGIAGVNWDVKLMNVEITGATESSAIAGYTYPMVMRKLYNQTNGELGAFIVATNSSWGSNGQPEDAPLWCAMYDSLGTYGVLSCGATTNSNANVDVTGDLPTACPSEYLLSVGRTNSSDLRASGGYGLTTIDLMAPGDNVYLANNSSYGVTTGTSFSSPCVAGAIALLYSAPCSSVMQIVNASVTEGALLIRDYILNGVDQTNQLISETVSGGRLNVNNSLNLLLDECSNNGCLVPVGVYHEQQNSTLDYTIGWSLLDGIDAYNIQYRVLGSEEWTTLNNVPGQQIQLMELLACTTYEIQLMSVCSDTNSNWTTSYTWTTDGCCQNPSQFDVTSSTESTMTIEWNQVMAAESYSATLTPTMGNALEFETIPTNSFTFTGLESCMEYVVSIYAVCGEFALPANDFTIHTPGCEACDDLTYCNVIASSQYEHIAWVQVGDIERSSASDNGYVLVTEISDTLYAQSQYTLAFAPGYSGGAYNENFLAWIDYNSDGDFDDESELIFDAPNPVMEDTIYGSFTVPSFVQDGVVRLRVAMRYTSGSSSVEPTYCGSWTYGETEDYCVRLDHIVGVNSRSEQQFSLFPNPTNDILFIRLNGFHKSDTVRLTILSMDGTVVLDKENFQESTLDLSSIASGVYSVILSTTGTRSIQKIIRL